MENDEVAAFMGAFVVGVASTAIGYLFRNLSANRVKKTEYLHHTPRFTSFGSELYSYLKQHPNQQAHILLEGTVEQAGDQNLYSDKAGVGGAGRSMTTVQYYKMRNEYTQWKWVDTSRTTENLCLSVPFNLKGRDGYSVRVENTHLADGFRSMLSLAYEDSVTHEGKSLGDYAIDMTVNEIPMGKRVTELMLCFGSPLAGFGMAVVRTKNVVQSQVVFTPQEVSTSVQALIMKHEVVASIYHFISWVFFAVAGGAVVFVVAPRLLGLRHRRREDIDSE